MNKWVELSRTEEFRDCRKIFDLRLKGRTQDAGDVEKRFGPLRRCVVCSPARIGQEVSV